MSAVVVNYNGGSDLLRCLESLESQAGLHEIIVVDNASRDGSLTSAQDRHPNVRIVGRTVNDGFGGAANVGAQIASGELLLFLNPDVVLDAGCVASLSAALREHPGAAGPVLHVEGPASTEYGATVDLLGMPHGLTEPSSALYVPGCALATNTRVFSEVGGFDARYFLFMEDAEYCWRTLLAGYDVTVCERAGAWHRGGGSIPGGYVKGTLVTTTESRVALRERNGLTMFLSCAPATWLPGLALAHVMKTAGVAVASAIVLRRPRLARELWRGLWWNASQAPGTIARRRSLPRNARHERLAFRRVARRSNLLRLLRRYGLPHFLDDGSRTEVPH